MSKRATKYYIDIPIYNTFITVYFSDDIVTADSVFANDFGVPEDSLLSNEIFGRALTLSKKGSGTKFVLLFSSNKLFNDWDEGIAMVSHECIHTSWAILEEYGVMISEDNHEALAYLQQFILCKVIRLMKVYKTKIKNEV